jgi:hypothetical protein
MNFIKPFLALIFLIFLAVEAQAASRHNMFYSDSYTLDEKAYDFRLRFSQWTSRARYDVDGVEETLPSGDGFQKRDFDFVSLYGMSKMVTIGIGGRWRQNISQSTEQDLSSSGLESLFGTINYQFKPPSKRWRFSISGEFRQTLYTNPTYDPGTQIPEEETLVLGDSGTEYKATAHLTYENTVNHYLYFWGGYVQPPNELSAEIEYGVESVYPYRQWMFSFGVKGIYSLSFDEFESDPTAKKQQQTGSTNLFNSINRSNIAPFITIGRGFRNWNLIFEGIQVTDGFSTDEGFEFGVNLNMRLPGKSKKQAKVNKFKEYLVEASVVKVSPRGKFFKIDKGLAHDIEKGMSFDIFKADYFGGNILVASGVVFEIGGEWAIIRLNQIYRKMEIRPGFVARGY